MKTYKQISALLFLAMIFLATTAHAQVFDEWEGRGVATLEYKINPKMEVAGSYYIYLNDMERYKKSVLAAEVKYKITKWLKAGLEYRHGLSDKGDYSDIRYSLTFDQKLAPGWKIKYRPMLQQEFQSLKKESLAKHPVEYYLRNRLTVSYDVTEKTELYAFTENYLEIGDGPAHFHRQKSALGAEFKIGRRTTIGPRFEVLNKKSGKMVARPNLRFIHTLGYSKKKP